jgi:hypothetical protein
VASYEISRFHDGFSISQDGKLLAEVWERTYRLSLRSPYLRAEDCCEQSFGFFEQSRLLEHIAKIAVWAKRHRYWEAPPWLRVWLRTQARRALAKRVSAERKRLLERVSEPVRDVQRAVFSVSFQAPTAVLQPDLYEHPFVVRDICRYRAAASAVYDADHLVRRKRREGVTSSNVVRGLHLSLGATLRRIDEQLPHSQMGTPEDVPHVVEALHDWMALYTLRDRAYRSLRRTLANLPGNVPPRSLRGLQSVELKRPIKQRSPLILFCCVAPAISPEHWHLLQNASTADVRRCLETLSRVIQRPLQLRRIRDLRDAASYLIDGLDRRPNSLIHWANIAGRWHRHRRQAAAREASRELGDDTLTRRPPIELPDDQGIRFLGTVGDVCEAADHFANCLGLHARDAIRGERFFFVIERDRETAVAEVLADGTVGQSLGARNLPNRAGNYGRRRLEQWCQAWPADYQPLPAVSELDLFRRPALPAPETLDDVTEDHLWANIPF